MSDETADSPAEQRPSDLVKEPLPDQPVERPRPSEDDLFEAMRDVIDPELMVNVVDLGLVYGIHLDDDRHCTVDMTLTTPACPLTDQLEYQTQIALAELTASVTINWVWIPPWDMSKITDDGREQLRAVGIRV